LWIDESETPNPELDQYEWESCDAGGKRMRISDPGDEGMRLVAFEQQGTHVRIWSDLERRQLLDLAGSLVPASQVTGG
jgi:hypothetical protein